MRSAWKVRVAGWMRSRPRVLAVGFQDAGERRFGERVHEIRGGCSQARIHAHIERAVMAEGKAALGFIELEGRDAEIESDSVGGENAPLSQELFHFREPAMDERETAIKALDQHPAPRNRGGIAIDGVDHAARAGEKLRRIAAAAEGGIDIDRVVARA